MGRKPSPFTPPAKTRPIAVQLPSHMVKQIDQLAEKSGLSRHKYMIRVLEEVVAKDVLVSEKVSFSAGLEGAVKDKTP